MFFIFPDGRDGLMGLTAFSKNIFHRSDHSRGVEEAHNVFFMARPIFD
jgi:hypothetical protein